MFSVLFFLLLFFNWFRCFLVSKDENIQKAFVVLWKHPIPIWGVNKVLLKEMDMFDLILFDGIDHALPKRYVP